MLRDWDNLPNFMKCDEVRAYYVILAGRKMELRLKRLLDIIISTILLILLAIPMVAIAAVIKLDSKGPIFYRQERITACGKTFRIHKFLTMVNNAEKLGAAVTVSGDARITRVGAKIRSLRLDELPQLLDVLAGDMSFVGARPEVTKYVKKYTREMRATLLLPAGITSEASIRYKDEGKLLEAAEDVDKVYIEQVLPKKMEYNLQSIRKFSLFKEMQTMFRTVFAVLGKEYS